MKRLLIIFSLFLLSIGANATYISIRLIKAEASKCTTTPKLYFLNNPTAYTVANKQWYNGENKWEIFFEIETNNKNIPIEILEIEAEGVNIQRAIVGRTDVTFTKVNNRYQLTLVRDTANGRHVQTPYQNPQGGPFVWIFHNWKDRISGKYLDIDYPAKALDASLNYTIACQEMLRLMGNMSGKNQSFNGEFILLNCESSAPRAHLDFPPHWHLQHWQHGYNDEYGIDWRKKQYVIPHYYVDSVGNIISNKQSITQNGIPIKQEKNEYLKGDTCAWNDVEGNLIFKQIIEDNGLTFLTANNNIWQLKPADNNSYTGVNIYRNKELTANVSITDDGALGVTNISILYIEKNKKPIEWRHQLKYDIFTGK